MPTKAVVQPAKPRKLLVLDQVAGFYHDCIPYWNKALEIMATEKEAGALAALVCKTAPGEESNK